ncbi:type IX secretion system sortase PorU [Flavobacterium sp.]|uniref:type IX secretion system sortase PorU n=1 Tax=Flavobacterium sp. TaxID=239 RepID=UPI00286C9253|nr:type IX secretion system sortase PorU [Flavobacterium sp.]
MKKIVFLITLLISTLTFAQQRGEMTINWTGKSIVNVGEEKVTLPQFNPLNFQFDNYTKQLYFNFKIPVTNEINENSIQITNIVYESMTRAELGDLSVSNTPNAPNAMARNLKSRDDLFAFISLSPIIKEGDSFKKIKSFSYVLSSSQNRFSSSNNEFNVLSNSVLSTGDWYRFYVVKSGVYRLSKGFLSGLGVNVEGVDPRKIKIYGNGGRMIPLKNSTYYPADLAENAIQVVGEDDGVFNNSDYVLFYAEGVDQWNKDSQTTNNLYDSKSYYYVNIQGNDGKRITEMPQPSAASDVVLTTFDDYQYHELDQVNIVRLGRRWFGEQFSFDDNQDFDFSIPNIDTTTPLNVFIYAAAISSTSTSMEVKVNGASIGTIPFSPIGSSTKADWSVLNTSAIAAENIRITLDYNNNGVPDSKGYLDYIQLKSKRNLIGYGKQFPFQYDLAASSTQVGEYRITNANNISQVWDVTDIYNVTKATNNNQSTFSFKTNFGSIQKYVAVDVNDYYTPSTDSRGARVANQNLKGTIFLDAQNQFKDVDYLIVCPVFLKTQAEKLANFHRNNSQLNVKVVTLDLIYQEFGSGKQDIGAIRNFVKYVYFNASTPDKRVKYLNLFGDASYDFKNRISISANIVPIYHALNSYTVDPSSFASDDYFGLMDDNEGDLDASYPTKIGLVDVAVGRMIGNTTTQADELVNKVIDYYDIKSYGNWRNNIVIVSDDADRDSDSSLQSNINNMVETIVAQKPFFNYEKILLDSYVQETTAGGSRYPKARKELFDFFEKGALVFNYLGHGGEDGLSQERIWEKSDGQNLSNRYKYPLFITITCEFSRFDNPFRPTAGEYTYWNPKGGAISMITTIREIYQSTGETFNDVLAQRLFSYGSNDYVSIAEALRLAKNDFNPRTDVVFYLGDPALKLAIPEPQINLTKVNDSPITGPIDDFKSLAYVKLSGDVTDQNNNPLPTYNGELSIQIFDKKITRTTLNNDNNSPPINFNVLGETIFRGNATVTNGQFEFGFVVPRDIAIPLDNGRISFYAKRSEILFDKTGVNTNIKIGGVNLNAAADNIPPKVKLYMNDQTFISGGITNQSPLFLAFLDDENGINTASGIGHDIVAILDGDESNPYKLNDYYETALDNYKSGKVKFPFRNLAVGLHTILFKAWDVYNNLVTSEIQFVVVGDESITINNVLNYPNPFVNYTQFWFTHNKPFEPLDVQVQVMTITGKIVWTKNQTVTTAESTCREITWDGKDDFGDRIGKGVYIYKLTVKSLLTNSKTEKYEKLVIL